MKMTNIKMKKILEDRLKDPAYRNSYKRDNDVFRIEWKESKQGMSIRLPQLVAKYNERGDAAIDELVSHVQEALKIMNEEHQLTGMEKHIYPVIRSTSFPIEKKDGTVLLTKEHTEETRIFYALDLGNSYRLIDEEFLQTENWTAERVHENALFNMRYLSTDYTVVTVKDNDYYFIATVIPHQDVLILADIKNDTGYDILAQMTMKFFADGRIPITSLPFIYEDKKLEPIFILAKNKPKKK